MLNLGSPHLHKTEFGWSFKILECNRLIKAWVIPLSEVSWILKWVSSWHFWSLLGTVKAWPHLSLLLPPPFHTPRNSYSLGRRERLEDIGDIGFIPLSKMHLHLVSNNVAIASGAAKWTSTVFCLLKALNHMVLITNTTCLALGTLLLSSYRHMLLD